MSEEIKNESAVVADKSEIETHEKEASDQVTAKQPEKKPVQKKVRGTNVANYITANKHLAVTEGFNKHGEFVMHELRNTLILGAHGTGKSVIVNNMISQLVAQYGSEDVCIRYYSNKGSGIQPVDSSDYAIGKKVGLRGCNICVGSVADGNTSLIDILEQAATVCAARIGILMANGVETVEAFRMFRQQRMPKIVYVFDVSISNFTSPVVDGYLAMIAEMADKVGVCVILTVCDGVSVPYVLYDKFPIRVYTGGLKKNLYDDVLGGNEPEEYEAHAGNAWVYTKETNTFLIKVQVPYYRRAVLKKIITGEVRPCGVEFDEYALEQLRILYQL